MSLNPDEAKNIDTIVAIGEAFHRLGVNSFRLESALSELSRKLGVKAQFFFTPTIIISTFSTSDGEIGRHVRIDSSETNLEKLCLVDEAANQFSEGKVSPENTLKLLAQIQKAPSRYSDRLMLLCFAIGPATVAGLISSRPVDMLASFFIGLGVGFIDLFAAKVKGMEQLKEALAAIFATFLGIAMKLLYPSINLEVVILSGLIKLLPGLSLTMAMAELAMNHLASGTARFMGSLMTLLKITFGVALAQRISFALLGPDFFKIRAQEISQLTDSYLSLQGPLPVWYKVPILLVSTLTFAVVYKARPKDTFWVILSGVWGDLATRAGGLWLGTEFGSFIGGLAVGALSNFLARVMGRPVTLFLLPGIILTVPGSFGYRSFLTLFSKNFETGMGEAVTAMSIAVGLVAGLFFGNILINPRRNL